MSAHKEEAKQRKRKSLKMALEKCMLRREAATTTTTNTTSSSSTTNTTSTTYDLLTPEVSLNLQVYKEPTTPQKISSFDSSHEMEALETTETDTSMDTSAEVNASDLGESRGEEDLESESVNCNTAKDCVTEENTTTDNYDDKPLDFTKSPPKKIKVRENLIQHRPEEEDNEEKDIEKFLKSTAVIKEPSNAVNRLNIDDNKSRHDDDNVASLKEN